LSDEQLLEDLMKYDGTKDLIVLDYLGRLPEMMLCLQVPGSLEEYGFSSRSKAKLELEEILKSEFSSHRALGYVFIDSGTFSKRLQFLDPSTGEKWGVGQNSQSIVFYGFMRGSKSVSVAKRKRAADALLRRLKLSFERLIKYTVKDFSESTDEHQQSFNLASA
jgi:hypothetical protein